jgi:hypothetical protein
MSIADYLKMTNIYISLQENLHYKLAQIHYYNWLSEKEVSKIMSNMNRHILLPKDLVYEYTIVDYETGDYTQIDKFIETYIEEPMRFNARVDAITDTTVWEFKCVETLELEHLLQTMIYAWLWKWMCEKTQGPRVFKIMNIRTSEVQTLNYDAEEIVEIMGLIIQSKYKKKQVIADEVFVQHLIKCQCY